MTAVKIKGYNWHLQGIVIFGLFMAALHPTITAGDSGEIAAAAFSLGIPHPPGYPLYVAIAKLFSNLFPLGDVAYRVNIVSAVFGAASCWMVYLMVLKICKRSEARGHGSDTWFNQYTVYGSCVAAFFATSSLALSHEFWYRSTVAEVYTLNTFLVILIIYLLMLWKEVGSSRYLYLAAFLFGLGIGNHHTIVLLVPGAMVFILWNAFKRAGAVPYRHTLLQNASLITHHSSLVTIFFLLGLSIYLYLPLRSFTNPFMDWGDPQSLQNFIDVFTRKTYLPQEMERGWEMLAKQLKTFNPVHEFTVIGFIFGLFGIRSLWKADKGLAVILLTTFIATSYGLILLAGSSTKDVDILKKFYLPAYTIFSILIGVGLATGISHGAGRMASYPLRSLLYSLCAGSLIWQVASHYPHTWNSDNYLAYDYGMNELKSLRTDSVYVSKGEIKTFPLWYLQGVERYREDVKVVAAYFLAQRWYAKETLQLVGSSLRIDGGSYKQMLIDAIYRGNAGRGVYISFLDEEYIPERLVAHTNGMTFMLHEKPEEKPVEDVWPLYQIRGIRKMEKDMEAGNREILKDYASSYYNTGLRYYSEGEMGRAMANFEKAIAINPEDPDSLNNLAALYGDKGIRLKEAEVMAGRAIELYTSDEDKALAMETLKEIQERQKEGI